MFDVNERELKDVVRFVEKLGLKSDVNKPCIEPMPLGQIKFARGSFVIDRDEYYSNTFYPTLWRIGETRIRKFKPTLNDGKLFLYPITYKSTSTFKQWTLNDSKLYYSIAVQNERTAGNSILVDYYRSCVRVEKLSSAKNEDTSCLNRMHTCDGLNQFIHKLGVPGKWQVVDMYGLDEELLAMVPKPVAALILLFPWNDKYLEIRDAEEKELKEKGQTVSAKVYFMKQFISNACGTIALIHCIANSTDQIQLQDGYLKQFLDETTVLDAEERGKYLMEKADGIMLAHKEVALEGQTEAPAEDDPVNFHFVAFVHKDGGLYELDGRKSFPINHGETSSGTLLEDAAKVCKKIMARDPENIRFTLLALSGSVD